MTIPREVRVCKSGRRQGATTRAVTSAIILVMVVVAVPAAHAVPPYCVLHAFTGGVNGSAPTGGLLQDGNGNFFGTTASGGTDAQGTVFELMPISPCHYNYTVLHSFDHNKSEGAVPNGPLVRDSAGNLYGTTLYGGLGYGNVFKLDTNGNLTVLHQFKGEPDEAYPHAGLVIDVDGNLYGTTTGGGSPGDPPCTNPDGCGVVFEVDTTGKETVLHSFSGAPMERISPQAWSETKNAKCSTASPVPAAILTATAGSCTGLSLSDRVGWPGVSNRWLVERVHR